MFDQNLQIIDQRWPELGARLAAATVLTEVEAVRVIEPSLQIQGLQLTSCFDRRSEAQLQASLVPRESTTAQVYGLALGDLQQVLLERSELQQLNVVMMNLAVARCCLEHFDQRGWLEDSRVNLLTAERLKNPRLPFAAAPVCLQLADESACELRDRIVLELATPAIRRRCGAGNARLQQRLIANDAYIEQDEDVALFFDRIGDKRAVVAAAGPSLAQHFELLRKERDRIWLIVVDAALKPLLAAGITPDVVLTIDPHDTRILPFFEGIDRVRLENAALVYFPLVHHSVLEAWPGIRFCAYARHPLYAELALQQPRGSLFSSGSVLHPAVDLAVQAGATEVVLLGADFCYPERKSHVDGCVVQVQLPAVNHEHWVLNGRQERVPTHLNMRGFLRDLEGYIDSHPQVKFTNGSRIGARISGTSYLQEAS